MGNKKRGDILVMIGRVFLLTAIVGTLFNIYLMFKGLITARLGELAFEENLFRLYWPIAISLWVLSILFINWKSLLEFFYGFGFRIKNFIYYGEFEEKI